jgi:hypothetical protein
MTLNLSLATHHLDSILFVCVEEVGSTKLYLWLTV